MRLNTVQLSRMDITDPFWKQYTDLVEDVIIPYQWDIMNDNVPGVESSHCLENFKIAAGLKKGQFYGAVFQDTDVAKWLEAVGYSLAEKKNEKLEKLNWELAKGEARLRRAQHEEKILEHQMKQLTRKERTHRLCTRGAMLESFLIRPEVLTDDDVMDILKQAFSQTGMKETVAESVKRRVAGEPLTE